MWPESHTRPSCASPSATDEAELEKALMIANAHYGNATHSLSVR
jgi:hypothetical protein